MDTISLPQLLDDINQHINSQEILDTQLQQAHALARVVTIADFDQLSAQVIHHYLWTLTDVLEQAMQLSEHVSETLYHLAKLLQKQLSVVDIKIS